MTFQTRNMNPDDVPACVAIINATIAIGGTTAYENPYENATFQAHYLEEAATAMVVTFDGRVVGFQSCFEVEPGVYSIGSFTDQEQPARGAGRALIEATIAAGLAYYSKMGFVDCEVIKGDLTRRDGTVVDRIVKRFEL